MASFREQILQSLRDWAKRTLSLSDSDVLKAHGHDSATSKEQTPFLLCQIPDHARTVGYDELTRRNHSGTPQFKIKGRREDTLQVDGYGRGATEWVEDLRRSIERPDVRRALDMAVDPEGPLVDQTATVAGSFERRVTQDFLVVYSYESQWFDASTGIAQKLELRDDSELFSYEGQSLSDALDLDMTVP